MINRKFLVATAFGLAVPGLAWAAFTRISSNPDVTDHAIHVTFDEPVRLPNVTLRAGTYIFEQGSARGPAGRAVRVLNLDRSTVYFVAFADLVEWPVGLRGDQSVTFGVAAPGVPRPITAWYPPNQPTGLRFIYPRH